MLRVENLQYNIAQKQILNDISCQFDAGKFNMILGSNGSGKSTFLKIISAEIKKYEGCVCYDAVDLKLLSKEKLATFRAVMSQQPELSFPLNVEEVVLMGRYPHFNFNPSKKDLYIISEVIERMNLQEFRSRNYLTLSGGEKQRVQFARVLSQVWEKPVNGFRYLFLDEPLNNLDINYQQEFLLLAKEFLNEQTILIAVMHDINLALQFADELYFFKEGCLSCHGEASAIITTELLYDIFHVNTSIIKNPNTGSPLVLFS